jgi:hypothetical protein
MRRTAAVLGMLLLSAALPAEDLLLELDEPTPAGQAAGVPTPAVAPGLASVKAPLAGHVVPAFDSQRILPEIPVPRTSTNALDFIAAQGETESASFVLRAVSDIAKLTLAVGDLASPGGKLAAEHVDLRLVKCWYQSGNAWFTTAGDPARPVLIPELLLHDDSLATCNPAARQNQFRVQGEVKPIAVPASGAAAVLPDDDAATLLPLALPAGRNQQFWMTVQVPPTTPPGIYRGAVALQADGKSAGAIAIALRVLPFELPPPRPRHDPTRVFQVILAHNLALNTLPGDPTQAEKRLRAAFAGMARHQVLHPLAPAFSYPETAVRELELRREAGLVNEPLWIADAQAVAAWQDPVLDRLAEPDFTAAADRLATAARLAGHKNLYLYLPSGPGAPARLAAPLEQFKAKTGARLWMRGDEAAIDHYGYLLDAHQYREPASARQIATRHSVGSRVLWGGTPAPGVENPEIWRRQTGLVPFLGGYDGVTITGFSEADHPWPDAAHGYTRSRSLVYPTATGWIGTLAWEAIREAIDDVRYFTLLNESIARCRASSTPLVVIEGRRAALWLHRAEVGRANLDTLRLDAIAWILKLRAALAIEDGKDAP